MSDHLPECFLSEPWNAATNPQVCICDRLRACEQRVLRDAVNSDAVRGAIRIAEQRTLDAAREAVAAECHHDDPNEWCIYVAAIDELREECPND